MLLSSLHYLSSDSKTRIDERLKTTEVGVLICEMETTNMVGLRINRIRRNMAKI